MSSAKIWAMIFNEIKCHVNTSLGLVGDASPPPVSAPAWLPGLMERREKSQD